MKKKHPNKPLTTLPRGQKKSRQILNQIQKAHIFLFFIFYGRKLTFQLQTKSTHLENLFHTLSLSLSDPFAVFFELDVVVFLGKTIRFDGMIINHSLSNPNLISDLLTIWDLYFIYLSSFWLMYSDIVYNYEP